MTRWVRRTGTSSATHIDCSAEDIQLMLRVRSGDQEAFELLYGRFHRRLQDFFFAMCRNAHLAEDLCQETFLRIWRLRQKYAATGSFPAYLFAFARFVWLEECRRIGKGHQLGVPVDAEEEPIASAGPLPDVQASRSEIEACVFAVLDTLPDEQRMAFVFRTLNGLSAEEVSQIMDCPLNTARSRVILAVKKLRQALGGMFLQMAL